jgi:hypothetical protein
MMSPKQISDDRGSSHFRHTPFQIIHLIGNFFRIWSVYSMYRYLNQTGAPVVLFLFCCLVPSSIIFLIIQKPWKGRALSNQQIVPSLINGVITALYFILWGKGLKSCGPLRAILSEYSGAVLGVLSGVLYGRRGHVWKKVFILHSISSQCNQLTSTIYIVLPIVLFCLVPLACISSLVSLTNYRAVQ